MCLAVMSTTSLTAVTSRLQGALNGVAVLCQDIQGFADGLMSDYRALPEGQSMSVKIRGNAQMVVVRRFLATLSPEEQGRVNLSVEK